MIASARKFFRRSASDRWLLLRALALHTSVAALLRVVRFGRLSRWLGGQPRHPREDDVAAAERIVWAVRRAAAAAPWGRTCLTEALTASVLLRCAGCSATLRFGVANSAGAGLDAHAWLEYRGAVLLGTSARAYAALRGAGRVA
jgi:hypothetical protein